VFDEWTADQDRDFRDFFYHQFLPELKRQGKTALVVTHDERYFHLADKVVKFESGSIVSIAHGHQQPLPESTAFRQALDA
jgi:ABC-type siderophore export system fused ATPase/permease subunit